MNIFDKWLFRKVKHMWDNPDEYSKVNKLAIKGSDVYTAQAIDGLRNSIDANGFTLKVYRATGGTIVETRKFDLRKDSSSNGLYIITDDKELGEELGKIITMEGLKA